MKAIVRFELSQSSTLAPISLLFKWVDMNKTWIKLTYSHLKLSEGQCLLKYYSAMKIHASLKKIMTRKF